MMDTLPDALIDRLAESCVNSMGDIFWDFDPVRDEEGGYSDPHQVALDDVKKTLWELARQLETDSTYPTILRQEYEAMVMEAGEDATDSQLVDNLVRDADWTQRGAREILHLARKYGTSILRNALALAAAMDIEDGESGL